MHILGNQTVITLFALAVGSLLVTCSDELSVSPPPQQYLMYLGLHGGPQDPKGWIGVYDTESDSIVGSFGYDGMSPAISGFVSEDGRYLVTLESGRQSRVWDLTTQTLVTTLPRPHLSATFPFGRDELLTSALDTAFIYSLPEFSLDTAIALRLWRGLPIPNSSHILTVNARGPLSSPVVLSPIVVFDMVSRRIIDSIVIDPDEHGVGLQVFSFDVSPDGRKIYTVAASAASGAWFICYDSEQGGTIFRHPLTRATGTCRVSPDGSEVWVTDPGSTNAVSPPWPGLILAYDASTGANLDTIPTTGYHPQDSTRPLFVRDIRFVPDKNKAYVSCGRTNSEGFPLLVIDTQSRTITKVQFQTAPYLPGFLEVALVP